MSSASTLRNLAWRVDELLMRPGNMAATRELIHRYLVNNDPAASLSHRLPADHTDPSDFSEETLKDEKGELPHLTPEQTAAACAALHDVHCLGVEKVFPTHDGERPATAESLGWAFTLAAVRVLKDFAVPWYTAQFCHFELLLATIRQATAVPEVDDLGDDECEPEPAAGTTIPAGPTSTVAGEGDEERDEESVGTRRHPDQPSRDRQQDILASIRDAGTPLTRPEIVEAMKLSSEGKLGHHLAWMTKNKLLVNIPSRGYWPSDQPIPH